MSLGAKASSEDLTINPGEVTGANEAGGALIMLKISKLIMPVPPGGKDAVFNRAGVDEALDRGLKLIHDAGEEDRLRTQYELFVGTAILGNIALNKSEFDEPTLVGIGKMMTRAGNPHLVEEWRKNFPEINLQEEV